MRLSEWDFTFSCGLGVGKGKRMPWRKSERGCGQRGFKWDEQEVCGSGESFRMGKWIERAVYLWAGRYERRGWSQLA